jgi:hypothetical protein
MLSAVFIQKKQAEIKIKRAHSQQIEINIPSKVSRGASR